MHVFHLVPDVWLLFRKVVLFLLCFSCAGWSWWISGTTPWVSYVYGMFITLMRTPPSYPFQYAIPGSRRSHGICPAWWLSWPWAHAGGSSRQSLGSVWLWGWVCPLWEPSCCELLLLLLLRFCTFVKFVLLLSIPTQSNRHHSTSSHSSLTKLPPRLSPLLPMLVRNKQ